MLLKYIKRGLFIAAQLLVEVEASSESVVSIVSTERILQYTTDPDVRPTTQVDLNLNEVAHYSNPDLPATALPPSGPTSIVLSEL